MYKVLEKYINNLTEEKVKILAQKNNIILSDNEISFTYNFIKKNWNTILSNPKAFNIDKYKDNYEEENFIKIKKLYITQITKYSRYI